MRTITFSFLCFLSFSCFSQDKNGARMFRGNAMHNSVIKPSTSLVHDTPGWQYNAAAPVRSTLLIDGDLLYFGTTRGELLAINKKTRQLKWKYSGNQAINSSPASQGNRLYFSDNKQTVYCLDKLTGKKLWTYNMGPKVDYPWRFDYYFSSPVLEDGKLFIGGDDGYLHCLDAGTGKLSWKYKAKGLVRSTPAVYKANIYFGDTEGNLFCVDKKSGKEQWVYKIRGEAMRIEDFGFDRKAILAAPVIHRDKIIVGARDGFLYCLNLKGELEWIVDHQVSWVVSTVAVKDTIVVTGTSDGRFVQAVDLNTGKVHWNLLTNTMVCSSPLIVGDKVYAGGFDGVLYCLDLYTGERISQFSTGSKIMSSPVWDDEKIYFGSDDGHLYVLQGHADQRVLTRASRRFVYHDPDAKFYFQNGGDWKIRNYMTRMGYQSLKADTLVSVLSQPAANTVIVMASSYIPAELTENGKNSVLRKFLDGGGRVVIPGTNSMIFSTDPKTKQPFAFNFKRADSVLSIGFVHNDTRTMGGQFTCFATNKGKEFGLPEFWDAAVFLQPKQVDIILGKNENGLVSAYVKKYEQGGRLVQVYIHPDSPEKLDALVKLAEWKLE